MARRVERNGPRPLLGQRGAQGAGESVPSGRRIHWLHRCRKVLHAVVLRTPPPRSAIVSTAVWAP